MASFSSSNPIFAFTSVVCLLLLLFNIESKPFVSAITWRRYTELQSHHHRVPLSSFFPSSSCNSPPQGRSRKGSLEVVHKHGPCSKPKKHTPSSSFAMSHSEILMRDKARVRSIHTNISNTKNKGSNSKGLRRFKVPAKSGLLLGDGDYFVTVGLGSPTKVLSLDFDTGSDFTWTQCLPCESCYTQKEPIFDPSLSSSYSTISCSSSHCSQLSSATGFFPICNGTKGNCKYIAEYGDLSTSFGNFAKEKLTISPTHVFPNFFFGCGLNNTGLFAGTAGLLGLGRDPLSFVGQTAGKYNRIFSYCLPSTASTVGFLKFGPNPTYSSSGRHVIKYIPFSSTFKNSSFYGLDFAGITIAGVDIPVNASSGTIIDSGTVITRLPPVAYGGLREEFMRHMRRFPRTDPVEILDTCYNVSGHEVVDLPRVSLLFGDGVKVKLDSTGIVFAVSEDQVCLGFVANENSDDVAVIGNTQQRTLEVVYDVGGERIGFRPKGCK